MRTIILLSLLLSQAVPPVGTPRGALQYADGCGGASWRTSPPPAITVAVTPATASLQAGQSVQLTAQTNEGAVTWAASPVGSVSATGLYTAPLSVPAQQAVTVTATSVCAPVAASATVTLMPTVVIPPTPGTGAWVKMGGPTGEDCRDLARFGSDWFVVTRTGVFRSADLVTWTKEYSLTPTAAAPAPRLGLAPDGSLLLSGYRGIGPAYRGTSGTWLFAAGGVTDQNQSQFITNAAGELLMGTWAQGKVFRSTDNGRTYSQIATLRSGAFSMAAIAGDIWVGHEKGVSRSQDGGLTYPEFWDSGVTGSNVSDFLQAPLGVLVATRDSMRRWNGTTFEAISGLDKTIPNWANYGKMFRASDGTLFLAAEFDRPNGDAGKQPGLWRSTNGSASWVKINAGITGGPLPLRFVEFGGYIYYAVGRDLAGCVYRYDTPLGASTTPPGGGGTVPAPADNEIALDPALFQLYTGEDPGQQIAWTPGMFSVTGAAAPCSACRYEPGIYWQAYTYGYKGAQGWAYLDAAAARPATTENMLCIEARMDRDIAPDTSPDHPHTAEIGTYFRSRTDPDVYSQGDHGYNFVNPAWKAGVWQTVCVDVSKPTYAIGHGGFGGVIPGASGRTLTRFYFDSQRAHAGVKMDVRRVYLRNRVATDI